MSTEAMNALVDALLALVILSFFVERGLATLFDWKRIEPWLRERQAKVPIAIGVSLAVCVLLKFDALKPVITLTGGDPLVTSRYFDLVGIPITALVLAGGSAGALKLMQDVMGITKQNRDLAREAQSAALQARISESRERSAKAEAEEARAFSDIEIAKNIARRSNLQLAAEQASLGRGTRTTNTISGDGKQRERRFAQRLQVEALRSQINEQQEVFTEQARAIRARRLAES